MKIPQFFTMFILLMLLIIASCTPPTSECDSLSGNEICLDGQFFEPNDNEWYPNTNRVTVTFQRVWTFSPATDPPYIGCGFDLFDGPSNSIPQVGIYTCSSLGTDSVGKDFILYTIVTDAMGNQIYYMPDTTSTNTFEISDINGSNISGKVDCMLYNFDNPSEKKRLRISFDNIGQ